MKLKLTKPLAFFDLETTGISITKDRIVEICVLKVMPDGEEIVKTRRINPGIPIPSDATRIHGITDDDVKDCPSFSKIANSLIDFLKGCDLAGYNSNKFDIPFIVEEFNRLGIDFNVMNCKKIDVQVIFHKMEQRTLKAAYKFYCGQKLINAHSAEADVRATYEVLKNQISKYENVEFEDKNGEISEPIINDMNALHNFSMQNKNVDLVGQIIYNDNNVEVFNFGKNKGKSVKEVFQKEPHYYDWIMKSEFPSSTKSVIKKIMLDSYNK